MSAVAPAAKKAKPAITEEASAALLRMHQTLRANGFCFEARTIRAYTDKSGEPLHIFHKQKVTVRRPDRLFVEESGDDGSKNLVFHGKTVLVVSDQDRKYASISVPQGTIDAILKEAVSRFGVNFPLADFAGEASNKAFLTGVTAGRSINNVLIEGIHYDHLFFLNPLESNLSYGLLKMTNHCLAA